MNKHWARKVMNDKNREIASAKFDGMTPKILEISGKQWDDFSVDYRSFDYPDFDICKQTKELDFYDFIVAEQVFEHLKDPKKAGKNVYRMLKRGGWFLMTTPFLVKIHDYPLDYSRWTLEGMKIFLSGCGFSSISVDSWGNIECILANFKKWEHWSPGKNLENDPELPISVWGWAQKIKEIK